MSTCGCPDVEIGFEQTTYSTTENNTRVVTVCASIRPGSPALSGKSVVVTIMSVDGSAIGMIMYEPVLLFVHSLLILRTSPIQLLEITMQFSHQ